MKRTNLITPRIISDIDEINRMCHKLHLPPPPIQFLDIRVKDKDGKTIEEYRSKSNSWTRNAYNFLAQIFLPCSNYDGSATFGAGSQSMKGTSGTTRRADGCVTRIASVSMSATLYNTAANAVFGILIGTSDIAESFDHYGLQSPVSHGTGAGQLSYQPMYAPVISYDSITKKWSSILTRTFINSSGGAITIKEIGNAYLLHYYSSSGDNFLISRDVLDTPIDVGNGQTLTVSYTSEITYPA